ncbi:hypothetical protein BC834DRAFT_465668 [Gloeopeniophorella convolvens]|nr:hypothetical protein BC834DRAFT_465668 [Gloeopeniophorella convolvens]
MDLRARKSSLSREPWHFYQDLRLCLLRPSQEHRGAPPPTLWCPVPMSTPKRLPCARVAFASGRFRCQRKVILMPPGVREERCGGTSLSPVLSSSCQICRIRVSFSSSHIPFFPDSAHEKLSLPYPILLFIGSLRLCSARTPLFAFVFLLHPHDQWSARNHKIQRSPTPLSTSISLFRPVCPTCVRPPIGSFNLLRIFKALCSYNLLMFRFACLFMPFHWLRLSC